MKRLLKRYILSFLSALLLCSVCLGSLCQPAVAAPVNPDDYGVVGSGTNTTWSADRLFYELFGVHPTDNETAYLNGYSGISFVYNSAIPSDTVSTFYDGAAGTLTVTVRPHTYVAANGETVSWYPTSIEIDGQRYELSETAEGYVLVLEDMLYSEDFDMKVDFSWSTVISAETADKLLTLPYDAAEDALAILRNYEAELSAFEDALSKHEKYLADLAAHKAASDARTAYEKAKIEYDLRKTAYDAYVMEKAAYDVRYNAFVAYTTAMKAYEAEMAKYIEYDNFVKNNQDKYFAYLDYLDAMEPIHKRLNILETLFVKDSQGRQFYSSFVGGAVSFVLDNQDLLISGGCDAEDVRNAGASTERLIALLKRYAELRNAKYSSQHKKEVALYDFYVKNYNALASDFQLLYSSLYGLYQNPAVAKVADSQGKLERFREFIGQLYITASCLNDTITQSNSWGLIVDWRNNKMMYLEAIVEPAHRVSDPIVSSPTGITVPAEVAPVEKVEPADWPGDPPEYVEDPRAEEPDVVPNPGDGPAYVAPPGDEPAFVAHPGEAPAAPQMSDVLRNIAEDLRAGRLPQRAPQGKTYTLSFATSITFPVSIRNLLTVVFYDMDGETVLDKQILDYGEEIIYRGPSTDKETTPEYSYLFNGWYTFDGKVADLSMVRTNLSLVASYKVTKQSYAVTWIVDGRTHEVSGHYYGEIPSCKIQPQKASDQRYDYVFAGWSPEIQPVTGDATYVGSFTAIPKSYDVTWQIGDVSVTEPFVYGTLPSFEGDTSRPADNYLYTFIGWKPLSGQGFVSTVRENVTYVAQYNKLPLAKGKDGSIVTVTHGEDAISLALTNPATDILNAIELALKEEKDLILCYGDYALTLNGEALATLVENYVAAVRLDTCSENAGRRLDISFFNRSWQKVDVDVEVGCAVSFIPKTSMLASCYLMDANGQWIEQEISRTGGRAVLWMPSASPMLFREEFFLRVDSAPNCDIFSIPSRVVAGERVDLSQTTCFYGYEITGATVTLLDGTEVTTDGLSFIMPEAAVAVRLNVARIVYHVQFIVDGTVVVFYDRYLGEMIEFPADPTKASEGDWIFTFTGWSSNLKAAYGENRNLVYEAQFARTNPTADNRHSQKNNNKLLTVVLPILLGGGAFLALSIWLISKFKWEIGAFFVRTFRRLSHFIGERIREVRREVQLEKKKRRIQTEQKDPTVPKEPEDQDKIE